MKRVIAVALVAVLSLAFLSAMDMSIGIGLLLGGDKSGVSGTAAGGTVDVTLDLYKGLGIRTGSEIITSKISFGDGLTVREDMSITIPVMAWYDHEFGLIGIGGGLGLGCNIGSIFKFVLSAGLELKCRLSDTFSLFAGVNGSLDALPALVKTDDGSSSTYRFVKSDFSRGSIYGSFGLRYRLDMNK